MGMELLTAEVIRKIREATTEKSAQQIYVLARDLETELKETFPNPARVKSLFHTLDISDEMQNEILSPEMQEKLEVLSKR